MSDERLRLFVALGVERSARREIVRLQEKMWGTKSRGLTRQENLHLTLVFLGETDPRQLDDIYWAMDKVRAEPPELFFDRIGVFRQNSGDIWWLGMKENRTLADIQFHLADNLIYKGFALETRKFIPHLTLARRTSPKYLPKQGYLESPIRSHVSAVSLMQSQQIDGNRVYTELYRSP